MKVVPQPTYFENSVLSYRVTVPVAVKSQVSSSINLQKITISLQKIIDVYYKEKMEELFSEENINTNLIE